MHANSANAGKVVRAAVALLPEGVRSPFAETLKSAIMTDKTLIPQTTREKLDLLIGKYL
jgi:5'-methylthioadenosine phosphorylase